MKLRHLEIDAFKNLRGFTIDFGENLTTVLLGQNGTGKSNLLEALILIFRDLDLGDPPVFKYKLEYECRGRLIHIDADPARKNKREQVQITVHKGEEIPKAIPYTQFYGDSERKYLPNYVFGYYSGSINRMEEHFKHHQERIYRELLRGGEGIPPRPFLYAHHPIYSQLALLSFFIDDDEQLGEEEQSISEFLNELLGIQELVSVLFVMQQPPWKSKEGDKRFWNASGVLSRLLGYLYDLSLAPMRLNTQVTQDFISRKTEERLYLYLRSSQDLKSLVAHYKSKQEFFKALEGIHIAKILSEIRIRLRMRTANAGNDSLTFRDLSEGEQQLLMVLGLLRFTKEEEALFLLDEPDTHLNPAWSVQYLDFMRRVVGDESTSQVIMSTHNPLVIAELMRDDVRIMQRKEANGQIYVETPRENPRGMGVTGILTSELFGLRSALDLPTQRLLDEQHVLIAKEELTQNERQRLGELTQYLDDLGFNTADDDDDYAEFLRRLITREDPTIREQVFLTPEQQKERTRLIDEILRQMIAEGRL